MCGTYGVEYMTVLLIISGLHLLICGLILYKESLHAQAVQQIAWTTVYLFVC